MENESERQNPFNFCFQVNRTGIKERTQSIKTNRFTDQQISLWSVSLLFCPHAHLCLSPPVVEHTVEHCTCTFDLARHRLHYLAKVGPLICFNFTWASLLTWWQLSYNLVRRRVLSRAGRMVAPSTYLISRKIPVQDLSDSSYLRRKQRSGSSKVGSMWNNVCVFVNLN